MSKKLFQAACEALWAPSINPRRARQLGIGRSSIVRYDIGERTITPAIMANIAVKLELRQKKIEEILPKVIKVAS